MNFLTVDLSGQAMPPWYAQPPHAMLAPDLYNPTGALSHDAGSVYRTLREVAEHYAQPITRIQDPIGQRFQMLAARWKAETRHLSSISAMAIHPAYQDIIGMGPVVVPYLLEELVRAPDHWFWALCSITGVDPVPPSMRGRVREMASAWVDWGRRTGYVR